DPAKDPDPRRAARARGTAGRARRARRADEGPRRRRARLRALVRSPRAPGAGEGVRRAVGGGARDGRGAPRDGDAREAGAPEADARLRALGPRDGRWGEAARSVAAARRVDPKAAQPELLECTLLATRFVLEGRRDALKIQSARLKLAEWR